MKPELDALVAITCATCRFWCKQEDRGVCQRLPPVPDIGPHAWHGASLRNGDSADGIWPMTSEVDWCGEHKPALSKAALAALIAADSELSLRNCAAKYGVGVSVVRTIRARDHLTQGRQP